MKAKWLLAGLVLIATAVPLWYFLGKRSGNADALGKEAHALTLEILAYGPRPPESEALDKTRAHFARELEEAGWKVSLQSFERDTSIGKVRFANLRARFHREVDPWKDDSRISGLLCAHVDSKLYKDRVFLGADDAASACAAVVVIGRHLAKNKPEHAERLELILFDGEEAFAENITMMDGLYGSRHYVGAWRNAKSKPEFGILLDMVGHKDLSIRIPSDSPKHLAELMFAAAKKNGTSKHFGTARGPIIDDHVPLNLVGIPTIDIIGDFANKPWWHQSNDPENPEKPADNASILSSESLSISIGVTLHMLDELLGKK